MGKPATSLEDSVLHYLHEVAKVIGDKSKNEPPEPKQPPPYWTRAQSFGGR